MLKNVNVMLWVVIVTGIVLASYTSTMSSTTAELVEEESDLYPEPIPAAQEIYDIEDIMGSIQDSTDQEQE